MNFWTLTPLLIWMLMVGQYSGTAQTLVVGNYTDALPDTGIYVFHFQQETGSLKLDAFGKDLINPSFLCADSKTKLIYACTDTKLPKPGSVSVFKYHPESKSISFLNKASSEGENPVFITKVGSKLVVCNYSGASVSVLEYQEELNRLTYLQSLPLKGNSLVAERQEKAHPHSAYYFVNNGMVLIPDLGSDLIRVFEFQENQTEVLKERTDLNFVIQAGGGPRHLAIHPNGKWIYLVEELSGMVQVLKWDTSGKIHDLQRISSYEKPLNLCSGADIHCSPDGRFLYVSNRIENSIAIFKIDDSEGMLSLLNHHSTLGEVPRNFTIDPSGNWLIVANQQSNSLVVFRRDAQTGQLLPWGTPIAVKHPSCLQWIMD